MIKRLLAEFIIGCLIFQTIPVTGVAIPASLVRQSQVSSLTESAIPPPVLLSAQHSHLPLAYFVRSMLGAAVFAVTAWSFVHIAAGQTKPVTAQGQKSAPKKSAKANPRAQLAANLQDAQEKIDALSHVKDNLTVAFRELQNAVKVAYTRYEDKTHLYEEYGLKAQETMGDVAQRTFLGMVYSTPGDEFKDIRQGVDTVAAQVEAVKTTDAAAEAALGKIPAASSSPLQKELNAVKQILTGTPENPGPFSLAQDATPVKMDAPGVKTVLMTTKNWYVVGMPQKQPGQFIIVIYRADKVHQVESDGGELPKGFNLPMTRTMHFADVLGNVGYELPPSKTAHVPLRPNEGNPERVVQPDRNAMSAFLNTFHAETTAKELFTDDPFAAAASGQPTVIDAETFRKSSVVGTPSPASIKPPPATPQDKLQENLKNAEAKYAGWGAAVASLTNAQIAAGKLNGLMETFSAGDTRLTKLLETMATTTLSRAAGAAGVNPKLAQSDKELSQAESELRNQKNQTNSIAPDLDNSIADLLGRIPHVLPEKTPTEVIPGKDPNGSILDVAYLSSEGTQAQFEVVIAHTLADNANLIQLTGYTVNLQITSDGLLLQTTELNKHTWPKNSTTEKDVRTTYNNHRKEVSVLPVPAAPGLRRRGDLLPATPVRFLQPLQQAA